MGWVGCVVDLQKSQLLVCRNVNVILALRVIEFVADSLHACN